MEESKKCDCESSCKDCKCSKEGAWVTVTVHNPDGTEVTHDLRYVLAVGIPKGKETEDDKMTIAPTVYVEVGRVTPIEKAASVKAIMENVEPIDMFLSTLIHQGDAPINPGEEE